MLTNFVNEIKSRIQYVKYTLRHRKALNDLARTKGYYFPLHDLDKVILYPILGKKLTHKLHRKWSNHHYRNGDIKNKIEAAFDWECARFTKPDKPLDAYDTWKKYYPDVDMKYTLKWLDLGRKMSEKKEKKSGCLSSLADLILDLLGLILILKE